jgi:hypothetical protein
MAQVKDVAEGKLPLIVAFAEEARIEEMGTGTPYNTFSTTCGVNDNVLDDSPSKDED